MSVPTVGWREVGGREGRHITGGRGCIRQMKAIFIVKMEPKYNTMSDSQEGFNNVFSPVRKAPPEILYGEGVPEETRRLTLKWMRGGGGINAPAVAFYTMFPDRFAYADRTWFCYSGPHWEEVSGNHQLPGRLVKVLQADFYSKVVRPIGAWAELNSTIEEKLVEDRKGVFKSAKQLNKVFLVDFCYQYEKPPKWRDELGANPDLLALKDGHVFQWKVGFRQAVPGDLLLHRLPYTITDLDPREHLLNLTIDPMHDKEQEVMKFLADIMPNQAMADYLVDLVIFILSGRVREFFVVFVGFGANGKGVLISLLKRAFGPHFCAPDVSLFMGRGSKQHGAADPEMAKLRGAKVAVAQEPEPKDDFRVGTMKSLVSADTISARALYENPVEFVNTALPVLACNMLPGFRDSSDGFARRARVVVFPFQFVDQPRKNTEKMMDKEWQRRAVDPAYGAALLRLAFRRLFLWMEQHPGEEWDIVHPTDVQMATEAFRVDNDPVSVFKKDRLQEDNSCYLTQGDMIKEYVRWARVKLPGDTLAAGMTMKELRAALGKHGVTVGKGTKGALRNKEGYLGWRFVDDEFASSSKRSKLDPCYE